MRVVARALGIILLVASGACQDTRQDHGDIARADRSGEQATAAREVTGTIRFVDLEGGFYGIETDEGARLDPVNLPAEFRKDGLRIRAHVERVRDQVSFRMWGSLVRITAIERL